MRKEIAFTSLSSLLPKDVQISPEKIKIDSRQIHVTVLSDGVYTGILAIICSSVSLSFSNHSH